MNKKLFKKFQVKDKAARAELARAHGMIMLLSLSLMFMVIFMSAINIDFNPVLTFIAASLLGLVVLLSLSVVLYTLKKRS